MPVQLNGQDLITSSGDYEEGIFTPQIADNNSDGSGECQAYSVQVGRYIKIGNLVHVQLKLLTTSIGNLSTCEAVRIVGLPFVSEATSNNVGSLAAGQQGNFAITAGYGLNGRINENVSFVIIDLEDATTGTTTMILSEWSADGVISLAGTYEV